MTEKLSGVIREGGNPEHVATILDRVLADLESPMVVIDSREAAGILTKLAPECESAGRGKAAGR